MLLEFLLHALSFDLGWIAMLILGNLHWVFALFVYVGILSKGKRTVWPFLMLVFSLYAAVDLAGLAGWIFVPILIFIPLNFLLAIYLEGTSLEKHSLKITFFLFFFFTFIHTFYFKFPGG